MQVVFNTTNNQRAYSDETEQLIEQRKIQFKIMNNVPVNQAEPQVQTQTQEQPQTNQKFEEFLNGLKQG